ncbi:unnamed protein product [Timema podura]|uniref:Uncharacterized protein n=1 Tax=Timema podura TaxID=61482 RepID=A0ABN7NN91_TIMPD|nr:unnamed protein product [Timema podura]
MKSGLRCYLNLALWKQGSSVKDYEDEAQLHFPASSATEMSPETRFASLVSSPPIVYWKRSMF